MDFLLLLISPYDVARVRQLENLNFFISVPSSFNTVTARVEIKEEREKMKELEKVFKAEYLIIFFHGVSSPVVYGLFPKF